MPRWCISIRRLIALAHAWVMGANMNLPGDISVAWAKSMPAHFDARFCAQARRYRYVIYNDQIRPAHMAEEVTWNHRPLDIERMREAAQAFIGTHDFSAFRARQCQAKSPIKTVHHLEVLQYGRFIVLDIRANASCITWCVISQGTDDHWRRRAPAEWAQEVLKPVCAALVAWTAHPYGLYLVQVDYPQEFDFT